MENTKILVLGGGVYHISLVKAIREMNLNCIAVSYFAHDPALQYANASFNISSTDIGALSELINTQKVTHIITTASEINTFTQAELNQNFGFNGVFTSMVKAVSHKPELVSLLYSLKLPTPKTDIIDLSKQQAATYLKYSNQLIFKPARGSGSVGVFRELEDYPTEKSGELYLVQDYIEGEDISGQAVIEDGKVCFIAFSKKWGVREYVPFVHWISDEIRIEYGDDISAQINAVNNKIGFKTGTISFDVRLGDEAYLIDYSLRLSGNMLIEAMNEAYDIDMFQHHIRQVLDLPRSLKADYSNDKQVIAIILGTASASSELSILRQKIEQLIDAYPSVNVHQLYWDDLQVSEPFLNSRNRIGHALLSAQKKEELEELALKIKHVLGFE